MMGRLFLLLDHRGIWKLQPVVNHLCKHIKGDISSRFYVKSRFILAWSVMVWTNINLNR
jgi:hypothetical protein